MEGPSRHPGKSAAIPVAPNPVMPAKRNLDAGSVRREADPRLALVALAPRAGAHVRSPMVVADVVRGNFGADSKSS
jgi:hypothetical protein